MRYYLNWVMAICGMMFAATFGGCFASQGVRALPPEESCEHNLSRIGKAITAYRARTGHLPPNISETKGIPCSWRAMIASDLHNDTKFIYRFNEPWDSDHNREQFSHRVPCRFTCCVESDSVEYPYASYLMLVRDNKSRRGISNAMELPPDAVLIIESANCGIEFGEPRDLEWDKLWEGESPFGKGKLNSLHRDGVKALRVDGKIITIPKDIGGKELRNLLNGTTQ